MALQVWTLVPLACPSLRCVCLVSIMIGCHIAVILSCNRIEWSTLSQSDEWTQKMWTLWPISLEITSEEDHKTSAPPTRVNQQEGQESHEWGTDQRVKFDQGGIHDKVQLQLWWKCHCYWSSHCNNTRFGFLGGLKWLLYMKGIRKNEKGTTLHILFTGLVKHKHQFEHNYVLSFVLLTRMGLQNTRDLILKHSIGKWTFKNLIMH